MVIYPLLYFFFSLGEHVKPFTPEKAKEIIMSLEQPAVFCNMVFDWPAQHWTAEHLSEVLPGKRIRFRMGLKSTDTGRTTSTVMCRITFRSTTGCVYDGGPVSLGPYSLGV